ncbi:4-phosphoerythronate dehydrogenase [Pseudoalteromonas sp. PPB1]|uniref:4-phosphoerythronate dehydrogenase n=1 Tax=Pseudoalteromonas sp. PPB1 TaxID=2756136 RepID=UPI00189131EE|nr:4-phosphoerythronate dehydrogenase [Pseudoalteromonas sp. PPB1]
MKILADQNMPLVEEFFSDLGVVKRFDGRSLTPHQLADADVLLTRSVTQVNSALLAEATQLKFVGTATIGVDHIDRPLLAERDIGFASAPGCNAVAVAEYVISALYAYAQHKAINLQGKKLGIVGVGNIGQCLREKLAASGIELLLCDPLRYEAGSLDQHMPLDDLLAQADIVTFHVPLVKTGGHQTRHLLNAQRIAALKPGMLVINASRGDVIDNQALLNALEAGLAIDLVLDVWENEPDILMPLLEHTLFASVHIAGHTLEGKARGTQMLYQALCNQLGVEASKSLESFLPIPALTSCYAEHTLSEQELGRLVHLVYDIRRDDGLMRSNIASQGFDMLRKNYPPRREFNTLTVQNAPQCGQQLQQLGFKVVNSNEE